MSVSVSGPLYMLFICCDDVGVFLYLFAPFVRLRLSVSLCLSASVCACFGLSVSVHSHLERAECVSGGIIVSVISIDRL